ncbi:SDR family NAD(P)-dependent oxidoreductase [Amycolatopsis sp. cg5]|uniref:SDR family NAD(P)-dependent oxidoreductase n=1 Tax=Amycolatopsis sp. cg5 TaxID=3238802 RepID=UPI00352443A0
MSQLPIAVVGVSALLPGSSDVDGFWRSVLGGRDLIKDVPESHWLIEDYYDPDPSAPDKTYGKRGAFLDPVDFDPMAYGIPPNQLEATDTTQLLSLMVADRVLADVGGQSEIDRDKVSVILGTAPLELLATMASRLQRPVWLKALRENGIPESSAQAVCDSIAGSYVPWQEASFPGLLSNVVAGRIANKFDLHGTNCTTDAACASSLAALSAGVNELALGQADMVITGGVDTLNDIVMYMCFSKTPALSPTGDCKPFSDAADGTILGEGLVMFALKRLADAERDGDKVYAVLRGLGTASDGRSTAIYAPLADGQSRALRRAYESAGYGPDTVELVEAHGTGTTAGDLAEFTALRTVFAESGRADSQWCALGSVKSQIGHTKSAAGAAGMLKAVLALHHKVLPPTIKVDRPNPKLGLAESPLYLNTRARPWIRDAAHPRRASVSSFGFGGSNFHLTLEEYMPGEGHARPAWRSHTAPSELVLLSAATPGELLAKAERVDPSAPLADLARVSQSEFVPADTARLAIVASSVDDLASKLKQACAFVTMAPEKPFTTPTGVMYEFGVAVSGRVGFLFSGQGSQYVGMGGDLAMEFPAAREVWDAAAGLGVGDRPLQTVVFPVPVFTDEERDAQQAALTATEWAQPALAVQSLAQISLLDALKISPDAVAGHSFGELVALHTAGAFDAATLVRLARARGEAMRDAASVPGAMLAVSATREVVSPLLPDDVWIANHNAPSQVVVSGSLAGIAAAESKFASAGIDTRRLDTATAFHSPLVAPAAESLRSYLDTAEITTPRIDVFANTDAGLYPASVSEIRSRLAGHVAAPVRFVDEIESMYAAGVRTFVEVGAGATLTGLVGKILDGRPHLAVSLDRKGRHGVTALYEALGRLAVNGLTADFEALWEHNAPPLETPDPKPRMTKQLSGANYGKPYPPAPAARIPAPAIETAPSDLEHLMLDVVADKTGYPVEMLDPSMDLESDLGIDSIKRVEILSAVRRVSPDLPDVDPVELGKLRSLGEIVERLRTRERCGRLEPPATLTTPSDLERTMLGVVADKTGYPVEMLDPSMDLESDLGIDSIKRVEILSAVRRVSPDLPDVDPVELGKLRSLGEIVERLRTRECLDRLEPAVPLTTPTDLERVMLDVVAEKTGYPVEMLDPSMDLESDLGIDSIKRVEILSAVRRVSPDLPDVDPVELGKLRSLGEIVERLRTRERSGRLEPPATLTTPSDLERVMLEVVAEKTGYPVEMLDPSMDLESDLGIDSIKRVEILAAVRRCTPELPEVDPVELGKLRSLGEIVERLGLTSPSRPGAIEPETDVERLVLGIVAEKTGYAVETLAGYMDLAGDLGIDSVKRVAIMSAIQAGKIALPEVDPVALSGLRSLGDVIDWLRASADSAIVSRAKPEENLVRHAVRVVRAEASGLAISGLWGGKVVVTEDGRGVAAHVVSRLKARGVEAEVGTAAAGTYGVVHLGGLSERDPDEVQREAFRAARAVAEGCRVFVTVQDTGGDFGTGGSERAWYGGLAGLARTAGREWPDASVKAIDCERGSRTPSAVAGAIVKELLTGGSTVDVGLRADGTRVTVETVAGTVERGAAALNEKSVIVATGGARGVTAEAIKELARAHRPRLVLVGRTPLTGEPAYLNGVTDEAQLKRLVMQHTDQPTPAKINERVKAVQAAREIRANLDAIQAAGSQVRYLDVDVRDRRALDVALDGVRAQWGPITGVVHGAGVLADKTIAEKTDEQFERVFETKVDGLRALLAATEKDPLTVLCVFSSIAARVGNPGQSDYAMANEVLNQVACAERAKRPDCVVRSIAWGPWAGGMVGPALAEHFAAQGVPLIEVGEGARAFVAELAGQGDTHVVVAAGPFAPDPATKGDVRLAGQSFLDDHAIGGTAVVPMAMVLEWFAATGAPVIKDLSVLRKIVLTDTLTVSKDGDSLELGNNYRAKAGSLTSTPSQPSVPSGLRQAKADVYDGHTLFHGPSFQAIQEVPWIGDNGATAIVVGARELGWPGGTWHTDPAVIDGGLQLALLWAEQVLGASLPMGVAECRTYRKGLADGPVRCVLTARDVRAETAECDLVFVDDSGDVRAELLGVSLVKRP